MGQIRFYIDEDVHIPVASKLRAMGFDALSTLEANRLSESDESQLEWASRENRALLTFNISDFARLHGKWLNDFRHHSGIFVSSQRPIGYLLRKVLAATGALSAEEMRDRIEYLSSW